MPYSMDDRVLLDTERESRISHFRAWVLILVPLLSVLFQMSVPHFFPTVGFLEIPLLITIYFGMMRRSQVGGLLTGTVLGLAEDSLLLNPIGMLGICRTLVGYFAASIALKIDVENPIVRLLVCFFFFIFDQFMLWVLGRALLRVDLGFDYRQAILLGALNAVVGLALFHFLDRLKRPA
jgi:rod shape-determining protein MreD